MKLLVGTRGSLLSLKQTDIVVERLKRIYPDIRVEKRIIKTRGDVIKDKPLFMMKGKGFFEKEIDKAVVSGEVDFAVHSMKDVPTTQPLKTVLAAVPRRESPHDVLVSSDNVRLMDLPKGAVVGTSSLRRKAQILRARPNLSVKPIRGNVETRVRKVRGGLFDAVIVAEVGLRRLGMGRYVTEVLPFKDFTPAPGQGALAVVTREGDDKILRALRKIDDPDSEAEILAERALVKRVRAGCKAPLGAIARVMGKTLWLYAAVLSPDGEERIDVDLSGDARSPGELGRRAGDGILEMGANELIRRWRTIL